MDRDIGISRFRIRRIAHPHRNIRPGVLRSVSRRREKLADIKPFLIRIVNHLLADSLFTGYHRRLDRILYGLIQQEAQPLWFLIQHHPDPLPGSQKTDEHSRSLMALHIIKHNRRSLFCRALYRTARADIPVDTGYFRMWFHSYICLRIFSRNSL